MGQLGPGPQPCPTKHRGSRFLKRPCPGVAPDVAYTKAIGGQLTKNDTSHVEFHFNFLSSTPWNTMFLSRRKLNSVIKSPILHLSADYNHN
ncbi:hypothetical protein TNCV_1375851 [Trichonephila clavipes]|nr:hypothetical protein TNCV_1375851 [Trichonephila clavipes]